MPLRLVTLRWAVLAAVLVPGAASAQTALPDTPAGDRARALVTALGTSKAEEIDRFIAANVAPQLLAFAGTDGFRTYLYELREQFGRLTVTSARPTGAEEIVVEGRSGVTGTAMALAVIVTPEPPHLIRGIARRPPAETSPPTTDAERVADLAAFMRRLADADLFSGTVLLARGDTLLFAEAYGDAHKGLGVSNTVDTRYALASLGKVFTAVTVARLIEQGRLAADDTLGRFRPDLFDDPRAGRIRVDQLLSHTSGLGSFFNEQFRTTRRLDLKDADALLALVRGDSLAFEPGTRWQYSNTGYLVLGEIVEDVTGLPFPEAVRQHVFEPAGMRDTGLFELDLVVPGLAEGYDKVYGPDGVFYRSNAFFRLVQGTAAGGSISTAGDLHRFALAFLHGRLVTESTRRWMTSPTDSPGARDGHGFMLGPEPNVYGHAGDFNGVSTLLQIDPETGYIAVILSNYGGGRRLVADRLRFLLPPS